MQTFKIYNNTEITFGFMNRLRILFGKKVKVFITIHTEKEVELFGEMTQHSVYVAPFIRPKSTLQMQAPMKY